MDELTCKIEAGFKDIPGKDRGAKIEIGFKDVPGRDIPPAWWFFS